MLFKYYAIGLPVLSNTTPSHVSRAGISGARRCSSRLCLSRKFPHSVLGAELRDTGGSEVKHSCGYKTDPSSPLLPTEGHTSNKLHASNRQQTTEMPFNLDNVAPEALGLMNFTWRAQPVEKPIAFEAMLEAIKLNEPKKTFFNGGEFYGANNINLEYIRDFFKEYPEQRKNVVVSIKGAVNVQTLTPLTDFDGIHNSIDNILTYIPDLDIFEPARLSPSIPFEETLRGLDDAVDQGKIKGFTFSEVNGDTLTRLSQGKHKPVGVEIEFSIFTRDVEDVAKAASALDIPIVAYSPLSRGLLTGEIKSASDIPEGDIRHHFERFSDENLKKNSLIVDELKAIAEEKAVTPAQLALAWLKYHSGQVVNGVKYPYIIPIPSSSTKARVDENFAKVVLTKDEFERIQTVIEGKEVHGHRYNQQAASLLSL